MSSAYNSPEVAAIPTVPDKEHVKVALLDNLGEAVLDS
jgi:hypothetical protein